MTAEFLSLYNLLSQGEIDEQAVADTLECIGWEEGFESKCESYGMVIRSLEADASVAKAESDRLDARAKAFTSNAARVRERLFEAMVVTGHEKVKTPLFSFAIQNNPESLKISDDAIIPEEYMKVTEAIDRTAVKTALQKGIAIHGCSLERSKSLRIR